MRVFKRYWLSIVSALLALILCSCMYHYIPVEHPVKQGMSVIDCKDRYLDTIIATREKDGSGYRIAYTCNDYPPINVQLLIEEL